MTAVESTDPATLESRLPGTGREAGVAHGAERAGRAWDDEEFEPTIVRGRE